MNAWLSKTSKGLLIWKSHDNLSSTSKNQQAFTYKKSALVKTDIAIGFQSLSSSDHKWHQNMRLIPNTKKEVFC